MTHGGLHVQQDRVLVLELAQMDGLAARERMRRRERELKADGDDIDAFYASLKIVPVQQSLIEVTDHHNLM